MLENIRSENKDILKVLATAVVKRQRQQELFETDKLRLNFQRYKEAYYAQDDVYAHQYSVDEYNAVGITDIDTIRLINADIRSMTLYATPTQMEDLLNNKRKLLIDTYVEENEYIKILMGAPIDESQEVYIDESVDGVPDNTPIHKMSDSEIQVLDAKGILDKLIKQYPDYEYLRHVNRRVNFMTARLAAPFAIVYANTTAFSVAHQVLERYDKIRITFMRGMYNEFYHNSFAMYESITTSYLISATIFSIISENPMNAVEFDFTSEDVLEAIYNTFSIPYMSALPKSIKISLAEKINKILVNKGSKSSIIDITSAFGIKDIYQYILYKEYKDSTLRYNSSGSDEDNYNLSFVRVPIDASDIHKYIYANSGDKIPYNDFVRGDARWGNGDGGNEELRAHIMKQDFSYLPTKYIGVDSMIDLIKNIYNLSHFNSFLFANKKRLGDYRLTLQRPNIPATLWESFIYCVILVMNKNGYEDEIVKDAESLLYIEGINTTECIDNDVVEKYKELLPSSYHHLLDYKVVDNNMTITQFMSVALNNRNCINALRTMLENWTGDFAIYDTLYRLHEVAAKMMLNSYYGDMKPFETYSDYLATVNPTLHTHLELMRSHENMETEMTDELISVLDDLSAYINTSGDPEIDEFLDFIDKKKADEMNTLKILMFEMIAFLKSYTIDVKDNNTVYLLQDYVKIIEETMSYYNISLFSRLHVHESINTSVKGVRFNSYLCVYDMVRRIDGTSDVILNIKDTVFNDKEYIRQSYHFKVHETLYSTKMRVSEHDYVFDIHETLKCRYKYREHDITLDVHETLRTVYYSQEEHSYININETIYVNYNVLEDTTSRTNESLTRRSPRRWLSTVIKVQDSLKRISDGKIQTDI